MRQQVQYNLDSEIDYLCKVAETNPNARRRTTYKKSVTEIVSDMDFHGNLKKFQRGRAELDSQSGWKFLGADAEKENPSNSQSKKNTILLFDPVQHCEIDIDHENFSLERGRRGNRDEFEKALEAEENAHKTLHFENLKKYLSARVGQQELDDFDPEVSQILSFAVQNHCKNIISKTHQFSQVRINLPLRKPGLEKLVEFTTKPSEFLEQTQERDEKRELQLKRREEVEMLRKEDHALGDGVLLGPDDMKREQIQRQVAKGIEKYNRTIELSEEAYSALGKKRPSRLNLKVHEPPAKKRKLNENPPKRCTTLLDLISYMEKSKFYRKSNLLHKLLLGRIE